MHSRTVGASAFAWLLAACASTPAGPGADPCAELLASAPSAWNERLAAAHALGADAAPHLLALVRAQPAAPGAPAVVALLGLLGDRGAIPFLAEQVQDRSDLGVEAALALGALRATAAVPTLRACVDDPLADATLRTACACALVRAGQGAAAAALLEAVVLAGTPAGQAAGLELGLPVRPRWALERYLVQRLLQQEGGAELAAAFDTDSPWATLEQVAPRIGQWLRGR